MTPFKVICVDDQHIKPCFCGSTNTVLKKNHTYTASPDQTSEKSYDIHEQLKCPDCGTLQSFLIIRFRRIDEYPDATNEILKDFNPDKVEQEIVNPVKKVEICGQH